MALEQFKTQILLLHSEQSTLDRLSAGFADRYTVHCATSGSEALNTLGETSIDVIVTAQQLPGMSGLDALREAKKRSPDTKCILLAGSDGDNTEALVGADEVFQVVRGNVTPESLRGLIDDATRQARLMQLAESANDTTANVDKSAEHIVMETGENGSSIITDATGQMQALNPDKMPGANVGASSVDVLVLTKDEEFLTTVRESSRGMHTIIEANTLAQAEEAVTKQSVGVAVVDAAMVGDNVEKLTLHLRTRSPRLVSIVAGRRDDGEMLMDLINRGKVYRFLLKPVSPGRARLAIEASAKHHMEAPDSAFKIAPGTKAPAPKPARPAPTRKARIARIKPRPEPAAPKRPKANVAASQSVPKIVVEPRPVPVDQQNFDNDRLGDAFTGDDSRFTETMTGIIRTVGEKFSSGSAGKNDTIEPAPMAANDPLDDSDGSIFSNPKLLGAGAIALVAVLGLGWWLYGGPDDGSGAAAVQASRSETGIEESVANGSPRGQLAAEDVDVDQELATAESSLLARNLEDATTALQRVAIADPENPRLPFLNAQLEQMQLRDFLDGARVAIREDRFEDAAIALNGARGLAPEDSSEIELVSDELNRALSAQRVDDVLAKAKARLDAGKLTSPSNDNARYFYELALSNEPGNAAAAQGLLVVASKLVLQARTEIDAGRFDAAQALLADARRLDPKSSELASSTAALNSARTAAAEQRAAQEAERLAAEQAAEKAAAEQKAAQTFAVEATEADLMTDEKTEIPADLAVPEATPQAQVETPEGQTEEATDGAPQVPDEQPEPAPQPQIIQQAGPVAASSLNRVKYVAPKYPRSAQRRGVEGWVEIEFTVDIDGSVTQVSVANSEPGLTFVNAAVKAVEDWEFEPVVENGTVVQKRAAVRMMFAVE